MKRWTRHLSVVSLLVGSVALGGSASANELCQPLDTDCLTGELAGTDDPAPNDVVAPAEDALDPVLDTVDPVVNDTVDRVDRILEGREPEPPGGHGGGADDTGGRDAGGGTPRPDSDRSPGATTGGRPDLVTGATGRLQTLRPSSRPTSSVRRVGPTPERPSLADRLSETLRGAVRSLAVVLALLALVGGFVLVQDRVDRRDPRLALAPVQSDVIGFG